MIEITQLEQNITGDYLLGYVFKHKVKAKQEWFNTPFKQVVLYGLLVNKNGFIDREDLKSLYIDFKNITKTQGKRYSHNKMGARRTKLSNHITNNKLRTLYWTWLKSRGLSWGEIEKALQDLLKACNGEAIEKTKKEHK